MGRVLRAMINKETNERYCRGCEKWYPQTSEFWYTLKGEFRSNYCKTCYSERHPSDSGSTETWRVFLDPYVYKNENQREETHLCLESLGWRWHESGEYFWKPGIVDENGQWVNIPKDTPKAGSYILTDEDRDEILETWDGDWDEFQARYNITKSKLESAINGRRSKVGPRFFEDVERDKNGKIIRDRKSFIRKIPYRSRLTQEEKDKIVELEQNEWTIEEIAAEVDRSITTIRTLLKKFYGPQKYKERQGR